MTDTAGISRNPAGAPGRFPPASRVSPAMSKHAFVGTDQAIPEADKDRAKRL